MSAPERLLVPTTQGLPLVLRYDAAHRSFSASLHKAPGKQQRQWGIKTGDIVVFVAARDEAPRVVVDEDEEECEVWIAAACFDVSRTAADLVKAWVARCTEPVAAETAHG